MKIGIIGAGQIGSVLTRRWRQLGHHVVIANSRGPQSLEALASETGAVAGTVLQAVKGHDVVVVTIPMASVPQLPKDLLSQGGPHVVIDTCNYYPRERDGRIEAIEKGKVESRWVSDMLGRSVIKTFNSIVATRLLDAGRPKGDPARFALPVAGDNQEEKAIVMGLIDELGFDPFDSGTLADSWRQQPDSPVYLANLPLPLIGAALSSASPKRTPNFTGSAQSPGNWETPR